LIIRSRDLAAAATFSAGLGIFPFGIALGLLLCGRRTLLSVTLGTATFVGLVTLL